MAQLANYIAIAKNLFQWINQHTGKQVSSNVHIKQGSEGLINSTLSLARTKAAFLRWQFHGFMVPPPLMDRSS